jgi:hypothetical protein
MIVLDWLMGANMLEELASSSTALKVDAAMSQKYLYLSFTSLHGVIPVSEDWNLHWDQCENLKFHKPVCCFVFLY